MHGRRRIKPNTETERLRKEKEATKIKEYNQLVDVCLAKKDNQEYDPEAFNYTTRILSQNPDFYTIWNFRRVILLYGLLKDATSDQKQETFSQELIFLLALFQLNPKSYWIFNHRRWCLENMPAPDWKKELGLVEKMLDLDSRNFHGWNYRRYVTANLSLSDEKTEMLNQSEFDFTTTKINQSFSNYSAWHQRSKILPRLIAQKNMSNKEKELFIDKEFDLVKSAFYTDPDDQSAWLYYWWLIGRELHHISVLGAYFDPQEQQIILAFDDEVGMVTPFHVTHGNEADDHQHAVNGQWHPVGGVLKRDQLNAERLYGFIWSFKLAGGLKPTALTVTIKPTWIVPSHSEARLARTVRRHVYTLNGGVDTPLLATTVNPARPEVEINTSVPAQDAVSIYMQERNKLLLREVGAIKELLELEPESKWCLQTLINLKTGLKYDPTMSEEELNTINDEIIDVCDQLMTIDDMRIKRFEDLRSRAIYEKATRSLIQRDPDAPKEFVYCQTVTKSSRPPSPNIPPPQSSLSLSGKSLTLIPTPSILLLIFNLDLSHNKLTSTTFLANLINLREVNLSNNLITRIDGVQGLRFMKKLNLQNNAITTWEAIHDGLNNFTRGDGQRCTIIIGGNPITTENDDIGTWNSGLKNILPGVEIIWD